MGQPPQNRSDVKVVNIERILSTIVERICPTENALVCSLLWCHKCTFVALNELNPQLQTVHNHSLLDLEKILLWS